MFWGIAVDREAITKNNGPGRLFQKTNQVIETVFNPEVPTVLDQCSFKCGPQTGSVGTALEVSVNTNFEETLELEPR